MHGPHEPKLRSIEGSIQDRWSVKSRREAIAVKLKRFSVVSGGASAPEVPAMDSLHYLRELESENTKLRSVAVSLALEISTLRGD